MALKLEHSLIQSLSQPLSLCPSLFASGGNDFNTVVNKKQQQQRSSDLLSALSHLLHQKQKRLQVFVPVN